MLILESKAIKNVNRQETKWKPSYKQHRLASQMLYIVVPVTPVSPIPSPVAALTVAIMFDVITVLHYVYSSRWVVSINLRCHGMFSKIQETHNGHLP